MAVSVPGGKTVHLSIVPIDDITPHEQTVPSLLEIVRDDMKRTGYQRDPILIDEKTHLALDGMHRIESLRLLKAKYALCVEYNYFDDAVKLERWLRTIIAPSRKLVLAIISKFEMKRCQSFRTAVRDVETGNSRIALLSSRESFCGGKGWDFLEVYRKIGEADHLCQANKVGIQFFTESEKFNLFSSESVATLYPARLSKEDVMQFVEGNELLPFKTTRYIVPVRPMGLYFPISALRKYSLSECRKKLVQIVNHSQITLERRNLLYEGRRYSEPIAIFRKNP
ncbi:MAG: ParB N-terminal domain-containing protein [Nitrososphaerales archaeon]